ncbi:MAG: hypothetical protein ACQER6_06030 [Pseudomonadota bacterium]
MTMRLAFPVAAALALTGCGSEYPEPVDSTLLESELPTRNLDVYPDRDTPRGMEHPCYGADRCLVAYVAPWCPACKKSIPLINRIGKRLASDPKAGLVVVMGTLGGAWDGHERLAERIDPPLFVDREGTYWLSVAEHTTGTPAWISHDGDAQVIGTLVGGWGQPSGRHVEMVFERSGLFRAME